MGEVFSGKSLEKIFHGEGTANCKHMEEGKAPLREISLDFTSSISYVI